MYVKLFCFKIYELHPTTSDLQTPKQRYGWRGRPNIRMKQISEYEKSMVYSKRLLDLTLQSGAAGLEYVTG